MSPKQKSPSPTKAYMVLDAFQKHTGASVRERIIKDVHRDELASFYEDFARRLCLPSDCFYLHNGTELEKLNVTFYYDSSDRLNAINRIHTILFRFFDINNISETIEYELRFKLITIIENSKAVAKIVVDKDDFPEDKPVKILANMQDVYKEIDDAYKTKRKRNMLKWCKILQTRKYRKEYMCTDEIKDDTQSIKLFGHDVVLASFSKMPKGKTVNK